MTALIHPVSWLMGLLLAPSTLALLGNLAGNLQWLMVLGLAGAVAIYWINAASVARLAISTGNPSSVLDALSDSLGDGPATGLYFGGRLITTLAASTVMLVTAGFVFNETFVIWFPNFGFAFALLGLVLAIHLMGQTAAQWLQLVCIALVLAGIVALTILGFAGSPPPLEQTGIEATMPAVWPWLAVLMLFVGFDLAANHSAREVGSGIRPMVIGLLAAAVGMALWSVVSIQYVPAQKLADTFIAHTLAARAVAGQTGRLIMGVVIIAGACAAVNALIWNHARGISQLTARWFGARAASAWYGRPAAGSLVLAFIIAAMMATGMAGTDVIDTYVRAGLYFWMLYYAAIHLGVLRMGLKNKGLTSSQGLRPAILGFILVAGSTIALIAFDPKTEVVMRAALIYPLLMALGWLVASTRQRGIRARVETQ